MRFPFRSSSPKRQLRQPARTAPPELDDSQIAAQYRGARVGGDFYDFVVANQSRLLFLLLDIAGTRDEAMDIAARVQDLFRSRGPESFQEDELNEAEAVTALLLEANRCIIDSAHGVRCSPCFIGCFNRALGTLTYVNAGHTPGLVKDGEGITSLEANGLPLGLFSHATHDAQVCVLQPGATLLLASRGLVETKAHRKEFGIERLKQTLAAAPSTDAPHLCKAILDALDTFGAKKFDNDITVLALIRAAKAQSATSAA